MQYKEKLHRIIDGSLDDKESVEPTKPKKPEIDERPHQPKEGQEILTDSKK